MSDSKYLNNLLDAIQCDSEAAIKLCLALANLINEQGKILPEQIDQLGELLLSIKFWTERPEKMNEQQARTYLKLIK
ncbi:hypothetical protein RT723_09790 [Psychrosphaera aquimarina]|uniref:Uncharacterized protein n=1 Tax=Psychrosphaera aquimarina TaxID=2044854 RepID=A0ABU3R0S4_9GAMM|nr:hypothetical protein [Psychrosphaera aquimarina]MDU0113280.1 hypothetical protein [Psychrosphaera aquimarina]